MVPRVSMALPCGAEGRLGRPAIDWQRKCRGKPWKAQKERRRQQPRPVTMVDAKDQKTSLGQWGMFTTRGMGFQVIFSVVIEFLCLKLNNI